MPNICTHRRGSNASSPSHLLLVVAALVAAAGCEGRNSAPQPSARLLSLTGCDQLFSGLVDHACFHASFGPFVTVTASAVRDFGAAAPNVNAVHTHYTVTLPGSAGSNEGTVKYRPLRGGGSGRSSSPALRHPWCSTRPEPPSSRSSATPFRPARGCLAPRCSTSPS